MIVMIAAHSTQPAYAYINSIMASRAGGTLLLSTSLPTISALLRRCRVPLQRAGIHPPTAPNWLLGDGQTWSHLILHHPLVRAAILPSDLGRYTPSRQWENNVQEADTLLHRRARLSLVLNSCCVTMLFFGIDYGLIH